jgi:glycine/D-amino acid oxidase-like deaminating enzyme
MMPNMLPRVGAGRRPRVFYNTGHGHLGWTLAAATAESVAEAVGAGLRGVTALGAAGLRGRAASATGM